MATNKKKETKMTKAKVYTIVAENRVQNSPYSIGNSDQKFDIVHEFPLPLETVGFDEAGDPVTLRFIQGCDTVIKEEQVERGWPEFRKPKQSERDLLTFIGGMMYVPVGYDTLVEYLEMAPWFKRKNEKNVKRPPDARIIYEEYDQEAIDDELLNNEELVSQASSIVMNGDRPLLISLLHLNSPGIKVDSNISIKTAKLQLVQIAKTNPDFILRGYKTARNNINVLVSKALDYGILNLDTTRKVKLLSRGTDKFSDLTTVLDNSGRNAKIEKTCMWLESNEGKEALAEVKAMVKEYEEKNGLGEEESEPAAQVQSEE